MPIDFTPEPLGARGLAVPPLQPKPEPSAFDAEYEVDPFEPPAITSRDMWGAALEFSNPITAAGTLGRMAARKAMGKPLFTDVQQKTFDVAAAAFQQEAEPITFLMQPGVPDFGDYDPVFAPKIMEKLFTEDSGYGPYAGSFLGARNEAEYEWIKEQLRKELERRQLLEENPGFSIPMQMTASLFSPTTLIGASPLIAHARGMSRFKTVVESALLVGGANFVGVGIQEWMLHQMQMARTKEETQYAMAGALILGGIIGAGASHLGSKKFHRLADDIADSLRVPEKAADDPLSDERLGETIDRIRAERASDLGAKAVDPERAPELSGSGGLAERLGDLWVTGDHKYGADPLTRTMTETSPDVRIAASKLADLSLYTKQNWEGVATISGEGGSVATAVKVKGEGPYNQFLLDALDGWGRYYYGDPKAWFAQTRAAVRTMMGDTKLDFEQFMIEGAKAMRRGDKHAIAEVQAVVEKARKIMLDWAEMAVAVGRLSEHTVSRGTSGGWSRKGGQGSPPSAPSGPEPKGPGPRGTFGDVARLRNLEAAMFKWFASNDLPTPSGEQMTGLFRELARATEDLTAGPGIRNLLDVLEGRQLQLNVTEDLAKRLQGAVEATREAMARADAEDVQKAASEALGRVVDDVGPERAARALDIIQNAFDGKMPTVDEIVDLFRGLPADATPQSARAALIRRNAIRTETEAIVEHWRTLQVAPEKPPERLAEWIHRTGGVHDQAGDILAMVGTKNGRAQIRPGMLRKAGPDVRTLDDLTLQAWEEGFLVSAERPVIDDLLQALDKDLRAGKDLVEEGVIRFNDEQARAEWIDNEFALRELAQDGITRDMSEVQVRSRAAEIATQSYDEGLDGPAAAAMAAHANHMLRMMDKFMETGKTYSIGHHVHQKIKEVLGEDVKRVADDTVVATAERFEPIGMTVYKGEVTPEIRLTFRTFDDDLVSVDLPWKMARQLRAAHFPVGSIVGFNRRAVVFFRTALGNSDVKLRKSLDGELVHEIVHNQLADLGLDPLTRPLWDRLVRHSEGLRVLDMDQKQYMAAIGHPSATYNLADVSMRTKYEEQYRGRANIDQAIREESVAHMLELWRHGQWMKSELEPIADILRAFERNDLKSQSVLDDLLEAERVRAEAEVAAIAADRAAMKKSSEDMMLAIDAWHGSPHDFDRFSMEHVGRGEGAQAFGHGLYFAEAKQTGEWYQVALGGPPSLRKVTVDGVTYDPKAFIDLLSNEIERVAGTKVWGDQWGPDDVAFYSFERLNAGGWNTSAVREWSKGASPGPLRDAYDAVARVLDKSTIETTGGGHLYEVRLDVDHADLLDWDKPLKEQPEKIRKALGDALNLRSDDDLFRLAAETGVLDPEFDPSKSAIGPTIRGMAYGHESHSRSRWDALKDAGIPGIRYLDGGSRGTGEGTRNIVIFDDSLVEIIAKDGKPVSKAERAQVIDQMKGEQGGLDMSPEARKARAEAMGFDTSRVLYHGTTRTFDSFQPRALGGSGLEVVWLTPSPRVASEYTGLEFGPLNVLDHEKPNITPVYVRGRTLVVEEKLRPLGKRSSEIIEKAKADGYDVVVFKNMDDSLGGSYVLHEQVVVFDPSNIRSVNAAFDPAESASSKLMAALGPQQQRRVLDDLGFYSQALEAARAWPQKKGTVEQALKYLEGQGVKKAEIETTGLADRLGSSPKKVEKDFWQDIEPIDRGLAGEPKEAIDSWVGGDVDTQAKGLTGGLMRPAQLEGMAAEKLDAMAAPVREALRRRYGDFITVYRGVREGGRQSTGRTNKLVSYSTDRGVAEWFAGARKDVASITDAEIKSAQDTLDASGRATVGRYTFIRNPENPKYIDVHGSDGLITDTTSIREWFEADIQQAREINDANAIARKAVQEKSLPVDAVVWATDRFNQYEIIAYAGKEGKTSITRDELVKVLEEGRVGLKEVRRTGERDAWRRQVDDLTRKIWASDESLRPELERQRSEVAARIDLSEGEGAHWSSNSLDPSNPTYSETVVHLPGVEANPRWVALSKQIEANGAEQYALGKALAGADDASRAANDQRVNQLFHDMRRLSDERDALEREIAAQQFRSGHFPEPNIVGHMMTSMTLHKGKPVYTLDQIQSDWAQRIRDDTRNAVAQKLYQKRFDDLAPAERSAVSKEIDAATKRGERPAGVRDEKKIAELKGAIDKADRKAKAMRSAMESSVGEELSKFVSIHALKYTPFRGGGVGHRPVPPSDLGGLFEIINRVNLNLRDFPPAVIDEARALYRKSQQAKPLFERLSQEASRLKAELATAERSAPGHPLVNTTDQWVRTTLRQALRQAAEADAEYIAIPSGQTVLSYNPGKEEGMVGFYDKIVPTALKKIIRGEPIKVETLDSPSGKTGLGKGFTLFPLTPELKARIIGEGQPMFALGPSGAKPKPQRTPKDMARDLLERAQAEAADRLDAAKTKPAEPKEFSPEVQREVFREGKDSDESYLMRVWDRILVARGRPVLRERLVNYFERSRVRAEKVLDRMTKEISNGTLKRTAVVEDDLSELRLFVDTPREQLGDIADDVINTIIDKPHGTVMPELPPGLRGALRARTLGISSLEVEDFLENNLSKIMRALMRSIVPDTEIIRVFGDLEMTDVMKRIDNWYNALSNDEPDPAKRQKIEARRKTAKEDLRHIRDYIRGTHDDTWLAQNPTSIRARTVSGLRTLTQLAGLGGMTLTAFTDVGKLQAELGTAVFKDGLTTLFNDRRLWKLAGNELKIFGTADDMLKDTVAMARMDMRDDAAPLTSFERGLHRARDKFGFVTLMAPWNAFWKQAAGIVVMDNILQAAEKVAKGLPVGQKTMARLGRSNLTTKADEADLIKVIYEQFKKHGGVNKHGVYWTDTSKWDVDPAKFPETYQKVRRARDAYRSAVVDDVDRAIVTSGVEKPIWMTKGFGRVIGMFRSFNFSSMHKTTLSGMQMRDARVFSGWAAMAALAAGIEWAKNKLLDREMPEDVMEWVPTVLDRSGILGYYMDVDTLLTMGSAGTLPTISSMFGRVPSRYQSNNVLTQGLGPAFGYLDNVRKFGQAAGRRMIYGDRPTDADMRAGRRALIYQNVPYLSWGFNMLQDATGHALDAKPKTKRTKRQKQQHPIRQMLGY